MRSLSCLFFPVLISLQIDPHYSVGSFNAKIVLEDGTPLQENPLVELGRGARLGFDCRITGVFRNGNVTYLTRWPSGESPDDSCPVRIRLKGYQVLDATLRDKITIVLKRENSTQGATVSATSLRVPEDAGKAYTKGVRALNDQKWSAAQHAFEKAVEIYPEYAQAWKDLGEAFLGEQKRPEAESAFQRALKADPTYLPPYVSLAKLNLDDSKNEQALALTTKALLLNPGNVPLLYFYDAVANTRLQKFDEAERSARRAVELDVSNDIPRAEYLLGAVLAAKGRNKEAAAHMQKYLERDPKAPDAAGIRDQIERLSSPP